MKSTWCPPANREPVLDIYIDSVERDIMTAKPTRIRDNLTRRERQSLKKKTATTNQYHYQTCRLRIRNCSNEQTELFR